MKINFKKLFLIMLITFLIGSFFSILLMNNMEIINELNKPIDVPKILFPIVWSIIFILISISLYMVTQTDNPLKNKAEVIYFISLVINSLWTLIFFGFNLYLFAFIWLLILLASIIIMFIVFYKIKKASAYILIQYIVWVIFAGYLNLGIYLLNK